MRFALNYLNGVDVTMSLVRENVASLYEQIAAQLRDEIARGVYEPSGKLPSEAALCLRFGVSRVTVRLAIGKLSDEGAVERKQGKGTFAAGKQLRHGLDHLRSFHESLRMQGLPAEMRLLSRDMVAAPAAMPALSGAQQQCLLLRRLHLVAGEPIAVGYNYLPPAVQAVSWERTEREPAYSILAQLTGMPVARADIAIRVGAADAEVAGWLGIEPGMPLLLMERTSYFADGQCCDWSVFYIRPERYAFVVSTAFVPGARPEA